ncbi:MAG: PEP-CTERM sorting domain-containing protein [Verrucomicrobiae bacterium]|nr:PEP-CTERM sorting domain-containing protein [Verrucomicrobiae bacterium]
MFCQRLSPRFLLTGLAALALSSASEAATILFDRESYVTTPGTALQVVMSIHYAADEPMDLFSYGVKLFGTSNADHIVFDSVRPVASLDFNGVAGDGALVAIMSGEAGVKGTVSLANDPVQSYQGAELATFTLTIGASGNYELSSGFFNTLGPTETIFVSGDGMNLDPLLTFSKTTISVVPEPSTAFLFSIGVMVYLATRRRSADQAGSRSVHFPG